MAGGMWEFMSLIISKSMLECARAPFFDDINDGSRLCVCVSMANGACHLPIFRCWHSISIVTKLAFDSILRHLPSYTFFFVVCIALDVWNTANHRWQNATIKTKALHLKCNFLLRRSQMKWTKILYASSCCCILRSTNFDFRLYRLLSSLLKNY